LHPTTVTDRAPVHELRTPGSLGAGPSRGKALIWMGNQTEFMPTANQPESHSSLSRSVRSRSQWELVAVLAAFAALSARLFTLISHYAVNVFFMDQWDFNEATLFEKHSLWEMFRWQHGPHRQGLGAVLTYWIEPHFRWSSRADAFLAGAIVVLAAALALYLKYRLFGELRIFDVCIPLILLTPLQYEAVLITANLTQGPLPLLLLLAYCGAWMISSPGLRYGSLLFVNFLAIHTGYCFFLGLITPMALALDYYAARRQSEDGKWAFLIAEVASLASLGIFFIHYRFTTEVECSPNLWVKPLDYLEFILLLFGGILGMKGSGFLPLLVGGIAGGAVLAALLSSIRQSFRADAKHRYQAWSIAILTGFCVLFSVSTAYGRSCLGPEVAQISRYVIWMEPGALGLYFFLCSRAKSLSGTAAFLVLAAALSSTVPLRKNDTKILEFVSSAKRNWKACYVQFEDIRGCNHAVGYGVYPNFDRNLKGKLEFLKEIKQNLYADP